MTVADDGVRESASVSGSLGEQLRNHIRQHGALRLDAFMARASDAYYAKGDVFGRAGDFITAPDISQCFGELIGLWAAVTWQAMGAPPRFSLVECGPGRGTLMADALRAASAVPGFIDAAEIHFIERSVALRALQERALAKYSVQWHDDIAALPRAPMILIANEFLDALPIRQFQRTENGWLERFVTLDAKGQFSFALIPAVTEAVPAPLNSVHERSPAAESFVRDVSIRIVADGGTALLIDYGYTAAGFGDTLQAMRGHRYASALETPGEIDLTAHVNFAVLADIARAAQARVFGPVTQGEWLKSLGIDTRANRLCADKSADVRTGIISGVQRLTAPDAMGDLFKVMTIAEPALAAAEGFE